MDYVMEERETELYNREPERGIGFRQGKECCKQQQNQFKVHTILYKLLNL